MLHFLAFVRLGVYKRVSKGWSGTRADSNTKRKQRVIKRWDEGVAEVAEAAEAEAGAEVATKLTERARLLGMQVIVKLCLGMSR